MSLILIVDDNPDICEFLTKSLMLAGYQTMAAQSAQQALHLIDQVHPNVLLLDLLMTPITGSGLLELLTAHKKREHMRVILMSAHVRVAEMAKTLHADGYLLKPFHLKQLYGLIKQQLGEQDVHLKDDLGSPSSTRSAPGRPQASLTFDTVGKPFP